MVKLNFAENFVALRNYSNMTQEQMGEVFGVSRQAIGKWENGESAPDIEKITAICNFFKVSSDELLFGIQKESKENVDKKIDFIMDELKRLTEESYNLYDAYIEKELDIEDNIDDAIDYIMYGCGACMEGNYLEAIRWYDYAAEYGAIDAIPTAIKLRIELMEKCAGREGFDNEKLRLFGEKIHEYSMIIKTVLKKKFEYVEEK